MLPARWCLRPCRRRSPICSVRQAQHAEDPSQRSGSEYARGRAFEIDENFARKELSEGERSLSHARREEIYRALNGKSGRRYDEVAAEATGQSARSVRRDVARGKALGQDTLAKVVGTSLDKGTELDALAKLPVAERELVVARAAAGELVSAKPPAQPAARQWRRKRL